MVRLEHHLRDAVAVAQIDENLVVVGAITVHPAIEDDRLADMVLAQFATGMSSPPVCHRMSLNQPTSQQGAYAPRSPKRMTQTDGKGSLGTIIASPWQFAPRFCRVKGERPPSATSQQGAHATRWQD